MTAIDNNTRVETWLLHKLGFPPAQIAVQLDVSVVRVCQLIGVPIAKRMRGKVRCIEGDIMTVLHEFARCIKRICAVVTVYPRFGQWCPNNVTASFGGRFFRTDFVCVDDRSGWWFTPLRPVGFFSHFAALFFSRAFTRRSETLLIISKVINQVSFPSIHNEGGTFAYVQKFFANLQKRKMA